MSIVSESSSPVAAESSDPAVLALRVVLLRDEPYADEAPALDEGYDSLDDEERAWLAAHRHEQWLALIEARSENAAKELDALGIDRGPDFNPSPEDEADRLEAILQVEESDLDWWLSECDPGAGDPDLSDDRGDFLLVGPCREGGAL